MFPVPGFTVLGSLRPSKVPLKGVEERPSLSKSE